ncbi:hypothetical protein CONLIGDRAFT_179063 [Coniochaeta ligniaria NRRL 30616]|uniref:Major facilitator superfamily (MFS) profile domain-containing protein n=1 Tax=Coniochaeta ligniaria NRRL 30616 TaxID=1408157 RepID=A0A1J7J249_9PEZI|nr:hypothetical protein CONLIGDRAFT_179063 [Coniochaeta ligniaria NRRL 30616]
MQWPGIYANQQTHARFHHARVSVESREIIFPLRQRFGKNMHNNIMADATSALSVPDEELNNSSTAQQCTPPPTPYTVFKTGQIRSVVALCALAGFFSPFSAFTYFPTLEYMAADLHVSVQLMSPFSLL